jgi:hypothetical protein
MSETEVIDELLDLFNAHSYGASGRLPIQEFNFEVIILVYMDDWKMGSVKTGDKFELTEATAEVLDIGKESGEYILRFLIRI